MKVFITTFIFFLVISGHLYADETAFLPLEVLMDIEIETASKESESLWRSASAAYVLTAQDIEAAGVRTIPDALRLVPGLFVASINGNRWVVSARGFARQNARQLLVMIDGRPIFNSFLAGVYWEAYNLGIDNVAKIEVIRGAGGALWGVNAINGVINIITKSSQRETEQKTTEVSIGSGNLDRIYGNVTQYGQFNEVTTWRMTLATLTRDGFVESVAGKTDRTESHWFNFRTDWFPSEDESLFFDMGFNYTAFDEQLEGQGINTEKSYYGRDLYALLNWREVIDRDSSYQFKLFYNRFDHRFFTRLMEQSVGTELVYNHKFTQHHFTLGGSFVYEWDQIDSNALTFSDVEREQRQRYSLFLRDEIALSDCWFLSFGARYEYYEFHDDIVLPSIRLKYIPNDDWTFWAAVSRAAHFSSRYERNVTLVRPGAIPGGGDLIFSGTDEIGEEILDAYEFGVRHRINKSLTVDTAFFIYQHRDNQEPIYDFSDFPDVNVTIDNKAGAKAYGAEISLNWLVTDYWEMKLNYAYLDEIRKVTDPTLSSSSDFAETTPENIVTLISKYQWENWQLNGILRFVDNIEHTPRTDIDRYLELDLSLICQVNDQLRVHLEGRNLLDRSHPEFEGTAFAGAITAEVPRSVFLKLSYHF